MKYSMGDYIQNFIIVSGIIIPYANIDGASNKINRERKYLREILVTNKINKNKIYVPKVIIQTMISISIDLLVFTRCFLTSTLLKLFIFLCQTR